MLFRRSHASLYPLVFFLIVICLFPFALSPDSAFLKKCIPGCIWMTALLANLLSAETIFLTDMEDGYLEQLMLSETPFAFLIFAKLAAQWLVMTLPLIFLTPFISGLFHLNDVVTTMLCLSLLIGTPLLTLISALGVALTLGLKQQGVLLGLIILPLVTPLLIFGVNIVQEADAGFSILGPLAFLAGITTLAIVLLPGAIAITLKISLDD